MSCSSLSALLGEAVWTVPDVDIVVISHGRSPGGRRDLDIWIGVVASVRHGAVSQTAHDDDDANSSGRTIENRERRRS
jgi:hypothetical protein